MQSLETNSQRNRKAHVQPPIHTSIRHVVFYIYKGCVSSRLVICRISCFVTRKTARGFVILFYDLPLKPLELLPQAPDKSKIYRLHSHCEVQCLSCT